MIYLQCIFDFYTYFYNSYYLGLHSNIFGGGGGKDTQKQKRVQCNKVIELYWVLSWSEKQKDS